MWFKVYIFRKAQLFKITNSNNHNNHQTRTSHGPTAKWKSELRIIDDNRVCEICTTFDTLVIELVDIIEKNQADICKFLYPDIIENEVTEQKST